MFLNDSTTSIKTLKATVRDLVAVHFKMIPGGIPTALANLQKTNARHRQSLWAQSLRVLKPSLAPLSSLKTCLESLT